MKITTYSPKSTIESPNAFYVLSKGLNSGKPMYLPCPNCFVVETSCKMESEKLFSYIYLIWKTEKFKYYLCGSVIPFLRITDFKKVLVDIMDNQEVDQLAISEIIKNVSLIQTQKENLKKQLSLLNQIELSYIKKHVKM